MDLAISGVIKTGKGRGKLYLPATLKYPLKLSTYIARQKKKFW